MQRKVINSKFDIIVEDIVTKMKQYNGWILLHIQKAATPSRFGKIRDFKKISKKK